MWNPDELLKRNSEARGHSRWDCEVPICDGSRRGSLDKLMVNSYLHENCYLRWLAALNAAKLAPFRRLGRTRHRQLLSYSHGCFRPEILAQKIMQPWNYNFEEIQRQKLSCKFTKITSKTITISQ